MCVCVCVCVPMFAMWKKSQRFDTLHIHRTYPRLHITPGARAKSTTTLLTNSTPLPLPHRPAASPVVAGDQRCRLVEQRLNHRKAPPGRGDEERRVRVAQLVGLAQLLTPRLLALLLQ